jgi:hypothetical protein
MVALLVLVEPLMVMEILESQQLVTETAEAVVAVVEVQLEQEVQAEQVLQEQV